MKRLVLAAAAALLAVSAFAADKLQSGLKPGSPVPAFQVVDVSGPNKGKQLCYRCEYGADAVIAAFISGNPADAAELLANIDALTAEHKKKDLKAFVVFLGGPEMKDAIAKIAEEKKITTPLTFLPAGAKAKDLAQYNLHPQAQNTLVMWNLGEVRASFANVDKTNWPEVAKAAAGMFK